MISILYINLNYKLGFWREKWVTLAGRRDIGFYGKIFGRKVKVNPSKFPIIFSEISWPTLVHYTHEHCLFDGESRWKQDHHHGRERPRRWPNALHFSADRRDCFCRRSYHRDRFDLRRHSQPKRIQATFRWDFDEISVKIRVTYWWRHQRRELTWRKSVVKPSHY